MNPNLHTLRATASFSAWWHLVPVMTAAVAIATACAVRAPACGNTEQQSEVAMASSAAAPAYSDGA